MNNKYLFNNKFVFRSPNGPNTNPESCDITEKKEIETHSELISRHEKRISIGVEASNDLRQKLEDMFDDDTVKAEEVFKELNELKKIISMLIDDFNEISKGKNLAYPKNYELQDSPFGELLAVLKDLNLLPQEEIQDIKKTKDELKQEFLKLPIITNDPNAKDIVYLVQRKDNLRNNDDATDIALEIKKLEKNEEVVKIKVTTYENFETEFLEKKHREGIKALSDSYPKLPTPVQKEDSMKYLQDLKHMFFYNDKKISNYIDSLYIKLKAEGGEMLIEEKNSRRNKLNIKLIFGETFLHLQEDDNGLRAEFNEAPNIKTPESIKKFYAPKSSVVDSGNFVEITVEEDCNPNSGIYRIEKPESIEFLEYDGILHLIYDGNQKKIKLRNNASTYQTEISNTKNNDFRSEIKKIVEAWGFETKSQNNDELTIIDKPKPHDIFGKKQKWHDNLHKQYVILNNQIEQEQNYIPDNFENIQQSKLKKYKNNQVATSLLERYYWHYENRQEKALLKKLNPADKDLLLEMGEKANS